MHKVCLTSSPRYKPIVWSLCQFNRGITNPPANTPPPLTVPTSDETKERRKKVFQKYYLKNKQKMIENSKQYYLDHKEDIKRHKIQYYHKNKLNIQLRMARYQMENKQELKNKTRLYYLKNKVALQEQQKQYRTNNKGAIKEQLRSFYLKNKLHLIKKSSLYYLKNKHSLKEQRRIYYLNNKEAILLRKKLSPRLRKPRKNRVWKNPEDVRKFLEGVTKLLHIEDPQDWYRISRSQLFAVGGGSLCTTFGSLGKALQFAFPEADWDLSKFSFRGKKSTQRWLRMMLLQILPEATDILEDFLHPDLFWDESSKHKMELDIWIPKYQLSLEYQGEHHYHDLHNAYGPNGTLALYTERDVKKKQSCLERGISLVTIPYWWDGSKESLNSTLHLTHPHIFPKTEASPIPSHPPKSATARKYSGGNQIVTLLMNGQEWSVERDPTGWIISEKLDGFRAFWDGSKLHSKTGKILRVPTEFTRSLPHDVCLDGELWIGYQQFSKLNSIFNCRNTNQKIEDSIQRPELWKDVKFCVFDAPLHPGHYQERHSFASKSISRCDPHVCIIPIQCCEGLTHLQAVLQQVMDKKGEGVMLYHPTAAYTSGRTDNVLKVKSYVEEDVKYLACNPNSYSFICEQKNGAKCIVKCSGWDYMFPPDPGTVLTVKHSGIFNFSQKMKYPFLIRVRNDLHWHQIQMQNEN